MNDPKLICLLKSFTSDEMKEFEKFLLSPYFIRGKNLRTKQLLAFYKILKENHPSFSNRNLTPEKLYSRLNPGKEYDDSAMRSLVSHLTRFAQQFLTQKKFESDEIESDKKLLEALYLKGQDKLFDAACTKALSKLESNANEPGKYNYDKYFIRKLWFDFYSTKKNVYKLEDDFANRDYFFYYVILSSLRIYMGMLTVWRWKGRSGSMILYEEIMDHVSKNLADYESIPNIPLYYNMIKLNTTGETEYFDNLVDLKNRFLGEFSPDDRYNLFVIITNYCNAMISKGHDSFRRQRFELDKEFISTNSLFVRDNIHVFYFNSATSNAAILGEYEWVENFIKKYGNRIDPNVKDFAVGYLRALVLFIKKDYTSSLVKLSRLNTAYPNQKQNIRNLILQIYFETGDYEQAFSIIDTSLHFLKTEKNLPENFRKSSKNFIKMTSSILKQMNNPSKKNPAALSKKLSANEHQNKPWLLEKINKL